MNSSKPIWRHRLFLVALAAIPVLMVTVDGPVSAFMRPIGAAIKPLVDALAEVGDSKYSLVPTGVAVIVLMLLYFVDTSNVRARIWAWLAGASGFVFVSVAYSGILVNLIKIIVGRARPHTAEMLQWPELHPFAGTGSLHSFPSGHTNTVFAIALAVGFLVPPLRRWLLLAASVFGFCRVLQNQHFVSDIVGGALLAFATTYWLHGRFARWGVVFRTAPGGRIGFAAPGRLVVRWLRRTGGIDERTVGAAINRQPAE